MELLIRDLNEELNAKFYKLFTFKLKGETIGRGRLKLFTMNGFNLKFHLMREDKSIHIIEMAYPFILRQRGEGYLFDYRIESIKTLKHKSLLEDIPQEEDVTPSPYLDNIVEVVVE